ncbi:MAG: hypothetical protein Kow00129_02380 [Thermoleophilia bacterium]
MKLKKRWGDLSPVARVGVIVLAAVQYGLLGAALYDLRRRKAAEVRGPKKMWSGLVFVNFIGPLAYFFWGCKK